MIPILVCAVAAAAKPTAKVAARRARPPNFVMFSISSSVPLLGNRRVLFPRSPCPRAGLRERSPQTLRTRPTLSEAKAAGRRTKPPGPALVIVHLCLYLGITPIRRSSARPPQPRQDLACDRLDLLHLVLVGDED